MDKRIVFSSEERGVWIREICRVRECVEANAYSGCCVEIVLPEGMAPDTIQPVHLVTLACLVQSIRKQGILQGRITGNEELIKYMREMLHLDVYFSMNTPHIQSESSLDLNLWKVSSQNYLLYSAHVADYLKRNYFTNKDLSALKVVLDELYANIADHADADGIAYSFIKYDIVAETIRVAFCDFGIGIRQSLVRAGHDVDIEFIRYAVKKGVTSGSSTHNRGFGLDTVVSYADKIRIMSGREFFYSDFASDYERTWNLDFEFSGTLIYFDLPVSRFDEADYLNEMEL